MTTAASNNSEFQREWKEFLDIQQQIDTSFQEQTKLEKDLYSKQKKLKASIKEQAKQKSRLIELSSNDADIKTQVSTHCKHLHELDRQILNPGGYNFTNFFLHTN